MLSKHFISIPPERRPSSKFSGNLIFSCLVSLLCLLPRCSGLKSLPLSRYRPVVNQALAWLVWGIIFLRLYFYLEDSCFTISCWLIPYENVSHPQLCMCPLLLNLPRSPPPRPTSRRSECLLSSLCDSATWDRTSKPQLRGCPWETGAACHLSSGLGYQNHRRTWWGTDCWPPRGCWPPRVSDLKLPAGTPRSCISSKLPDAVDAAHSKGPHFGNAALINSIYFT